MGSHSVKKGHAYERVIAKLLTEWSGFKWWRTQGSGSTDAESRADVIAKEKKSPVFIECKHLKHLKCKDLLLATNRFSEILYKTEKLAEDEGVPWLVVCRLEGIDFFMSMLSLE